MTDTHHIIPGDILKLTIEGEVVDPSWANTSKATTLRIFRPAGSRVLLAEPLPLLKVEAILEPGVKIDYTIESRFKNGVHIDSNGKYWMRRPDGWFSMAVAEAAVPNIFGSQFAPDGVQRLKEDKDS
jgi:hypothetical protein